MKKFSYGKQDWKNLERGEENCYLMTNGLGGFSSLSMVASCSRNDQAVLMGCVHSPNHRYNMIHRLEEILWFGSDSGTAARCTQENMPASVHLSSQAFQYPRMPEEGYLYQWGFTFQDYPQWRYLVRGVEVTRTIALMQGHNTVGISYRIRNRSTQDVVLRVSPHLQFVPKGQRLSPDQIFHMELSGEGTRGRICANGQVLYLHTNGNCTRTPVRYVDSLYYRNDVADGKMALGRSAVNHEICFGLGPGEAGTLEVVYGMDGEQLPSMAEIMDGITSHRRNLEEKAGFQDPVASCLVLAADQFVSQRSSTGKKTLLAGFPFFEDWGRDTMIALVGCCLSTKRFHTAKSILQTFMAYCRKGLMPNLFPEGGQEPGYNTVDASLLFILAVYEYYRKSGDATFVREAYPVMQMIIQWYRQGTDYGICMDEDGLIRAGRGTDQVTWMDVRVEDILPTPRHGKPVEVNAYWYNALRIMDTLAGELSLDGMDYCLLVSKVYESFGALFWNPERACLRDVVSGTGADDQIRCNQIWAVSLPYSLLSRDREIRVVETVFRELYTGVGLRTLEPGDAQFHPFYGGAQLDRDLAYHQGTVWVFPLGGYYLAYLKVHDNSLEARDYVREQLKGMESALREGCVGQLPEIYDGGNPVNSKGCFAQGWSVGEILRVYEKLEEERHV